MMLLFNNYVKEMWRQHAKYTGIAAVIFLIIGILIPSEKTIWMMIGAYKLTPDNIALTQDNLVNFAEHITNTMKQK